MDFNTTICKMIYPIIPQNVSILLEEKKVARKYIKILNGKKYTTFLI